MTERRRTEGFEGRLEEAVWSYSGEGVRTFDPVVISGRARSGRAGVLGWDGPAIGDRRVLRFVLVAALMASAALAIALAGAWRTEVPRSLSGVIVVGAGDQFSTIDMGLSTVRPLTPVTPHDANPVWSPDGTHIAFISHDGRAPVQVMDADGTNRRVLTPGFAAGSPAVWSPDGSRLAFGGYRYPGAADEGLWIVDADGSGLTRIVATETSPGRLAWSPDGSLIAFSRSDAGAVEVVDVATGVVTRVGGPLVDEAGDSSPLAWQPGRMALLYARARSGERHDLVLAERSGDTWTQRPLITDLAHGPAHAAWLDADRFVFILWDRAPWTSTTGGRAVVASADGTIDRVLGDDGIEPWATGCVSPDGSAVAYPVISAFDSEGSPSAFELVIVPMDERPAIRIPTAGFSSADTVPCSWRGSSTTPP